MVYTVVLFYLLVDRINDPEIMIVERLGFKDIKDLSDQIDTIRHRNRR